MDRVQFLHKLEVEGQDFTSMVLSSFDQLMALYCIVGHYDNIHITNEGNLTFTITFNDNSMIDILIGIINNNGNRIIIYERNFGIMINWKTDSQVNLTIS